MQAEDVVETPSEPVQEELLDTGGLQRSIEAVLFVASEALSIKTLSKLTGAEEPEVTVALQRIDEEFAEHRTEPNSSLGQAFRYMLKHWEGLTRFLTVAGSPIDNNVAERALKRAVLLRKNALFYKNEHGASVGAILQSLIETCRLNGVSAWEYLLTLIRNQSEARANPAAYLPWSYAREEPEEVGERRAA